LGREVEFSAIVVGISDIFGGPNKLSGLNDTLEYQMLEYTCALARFITPFPHKKLMRSFFCSTYTTPGAQLAPIQFRQAIDGFLGSMDR
jgi:hypothetical protein